MILNAAYKLNVFYYFYRSSKDPIASLSVMDMDHEKRHNKMSYLI